MKPLNGVTVIALEQAVAAPFATRQLADLGARVIKIERPGVGDFARHYDAAVNGLSSHFVWLNRSKESLTLNLKHPKGKEVLERLLESADVFIQNLAPGAIGRLGFAPDVLRERYPQLIICNLSGYGSSGPYRDKKAYDLLVQAETGLLSITGTKDVPSKAGIAVADIAGGMYAYSGTLAALLHRMSTGQGAVIEVSLFEALAEWMSYPAYYASYGGTAPQRTGAFHATVAPYGPFSTSDSKQIFLAIQNEREWKAFCEVVLLRPEVAKDPRFETNAKRVEQRIALQQVVSAGLETLSIDEVISRLEAARIAYSRMRTIEEFLHHPQLKALGCWAEVGSAAGPLWALRPPVTMEGVNVEFKPIPEVGQHTETILQEYGFSSSDIAEFHRADVI